MVLHNAQAILEQAYADAHASDEFLEDESISTNEDAFTCVICGCSELFVDGEWECGC